MKKVSLSLLIIMLLIFSGCGGGQSASSSPSSAPVFPSSPMTALSSTPSAQFTFAPTASQLYLNQGQQVNFSITSNNAPGTTYAWSATAGNPTSGNTAIFSWTAPSSNGTYTVKATASDSGVTNSWTVQVCNPINSLTYVVSTPGYPTPLQGVAIQILAGLDTYQAVTGAGTSGATINNIPNAPMYVKISLNGYVTFYKWMDFTKSSQNSNLIENDTIYPWSYFDTLFAPKVVNHTKALITGLVNDSFGNPISGAVVKISPSNGTIFYFNSSNQPDFSLTATSSTGKYGIFNVNNGTYTISVKGAGKTYSNSQVPVTEPALYSAHPLIGN